MEGEPCASVRVEWRCTGGVVWCRVRGAVVEHDHLVRSCHGVYGVWRVCGQLSAYALCKAWDIISLIRSASPDDLKRMLKCQKKPERVRILRASTPQSRSLHTASVNGRAHVCHTLRETRAASGRAGGHALVSRIKKITSQPQRANVREGKRGACWSTERWTSSTYPALPAPYAPRSRMSRRSRADRLPPASVRD